MESHLRFDHKDAFNDRVDTALYSLQDAIDTIVGGDLEKAHALILQAQDALPKRT